MEFGLVSVAFVIGGTHLVTTVVRFDPSDFPTLRLDYLLQRFPRLPFGQRDLAVWFGQRRSGAEDGEN